MPKPSVHDCKISELPRVADPRGSLTFLEGTRHLPFEIRRIFYIYDVPTAESRGAHAHKELYQFMICLSGSFDVALHDGVEKTVIHLNRPWQGLLVPPMIWSAETNFDPGTVCLVLASDIYRREDYIYDFDEYLAKRK